MKNLNKKIRGREFSLSVIFLSISLILGYVESLFPLNIGILGIKIGLPNIITIISLKTLNTKRTFIINVLRLVILGVLFSNVIRFAISVVGFLFSFIVMILSIKILRFNTIVSSILGGVFHNVGQVVAVAFINGNIEIFKLLYLYIILGIISGLIIGIISDIAYKTTIKITIE